MGSLTDVNIASWQEASGISPATGAKRNLLIDMSYVAFDLIKIIALERSGIRDGAGYWCGSDPLGGLADDLQRMMLRLRELDRKDRGG